MMILKTKPGYRDRVVRHSLMWVNGKPKHNFIDDECVQDFSCCYPDMFTEELETRMKGHQYLLTRMANKRLKNG
jgi:hypothetical protein